MIWKRRKKQTVVFHRRCRNCGHEKAESITDRKILIPLHLALLHPCWEYFPERKGEFGVMEIIKTTRS